MASDSEDPRDLLVERLVTASIAKYRHLLPPEALEELRVVMEGFALTHPEMRKMVDLLRPRASADTSDVVPKEGQAGPGAGVAEGRKVG